MSKYLINEFNSYNYSKEKDEDLRKAYIIEDLLKREQECFWKEQLFSLLILSYPGKIPADEHKDLLDKISQSTVKPRVAPKQLTEEEMRKKLSRLYQRSKSNASVDIIVSHYPALGIGDGQDTTHRGYQSIREFVIKMQPAYFIYGHNHLNYGRAILLLELPSLWRIQDLRYRRKNQNKLKLTNKYN